ncbi:MAG TPA: class E sortase [Acidimicrobiia bacterium]|nr:class E sortase [Acidimicrobiia bacterium]
MRRTAASVGRMLVTVGVLILLFVAYQLWGTGYFTQRAQRDLRHQFEQELNDNPTVGSSTTSAPPSTTGVAPTTTAPATTAAKVVQVLQEGGPAARIRIPKIGVNDIVVQGTARDDLAKGPGHYPATPLPGQIGNVAIAGHRTTHSKPFYNLNELVPGDDIIIDTLGYGTYTYRMYEQLIVPPSDVSVVAPTSDAELTLTTCNPRYSARQRLVVKARLVVNRSAPARVSVPVKVVSPVRSSGDKKTSLADSLSGDISSRTPTFIWGTLTVLLGLLWWWLYRRFRHPLTWLGGVLPFLVVLIAFYVYLERLLPANF